MYKTFSILTHRQKLGSCSLSFLVQPGKIPGIYLCLNASRIYNTFSIFTRNRKKIWHLFYVLFGSLRWKSWRIVMAERFYITRLAFPPVERKKSYLFVVLNLCKCTIQQRTTTRGTFMVRLAWYTIYGYACFIHDVIFSRAHSPINKEWLQWIFVHMHPILSNGVRSESLRRYWILHSKHLTHWDMHHYQQK